MAIYAFTDPSGAGHNAPVYPDYKTAFDAVTDLSRLQHIIDHVWQNGKLYLILCGSSMGFMEHQVLGYRR